MFICLNIGSLLPRIDAAGNRYDIFYVRKAKVTQVATQYYVGLI